MDVKPEVKPPPGTTTIQGGVIVAMADEDTIAIVTNITTQRGNKGVNLEARSRKSPTTYSTILVRMMRCSSTNP
jgi:acyl-coenzyme A thioesterase PaaI-like protein